MPLQSAPNQTFFMLVLGATPVERVYLRKVTATHEWQAVGT